MVNDDIPEGTPKIYVACLEAYNSGCLYGAWIDATQDVEQIYEDIFNMLKSSPFAGTDEWEIHDSEYMGGIPTIHSGVEDSHAIAMFVLEYGEDLAVALLEYTSNDLEETKRLMEESYQGEYDSERDFARQLYEDCMEIPDHLAYYIDYDAIARDLFICDYFALTVKNKMYIFQQE